MGTTMSWSVETLIPGHMQWLAHHVSKVCRNQEVESVIKA